jgi:hypothetical protein
MIAIRGRLLPAEDLVALGERASAKLVVFRNTDFANPGGAKIRSMNEVCLLDPGSYGQGRPSGVLNKTEPVAQGDASLFQGIIYRASSKGGAPAGAVEATSMASAEDMKLESGSPAPVLTEQ